MNILLMYSTHEPSEAHVSRLKAITQKSHVAVAHSEEEAIRAAEEADVIFGHRYLRQVMPHVRRLKWVQSTAGGTDRLPLQMLRDKQVILSRCTLFSDVIARFALKLSDSLVTRKVDEFLRPSQPKWHLELAPLPSPKTAMVVGMSHIGREIAKILKSRGLFVIGASRSGEGLAAPFCEARYNAESWPTHLKEADLCFLALPRNTSTEALFDEGMLQSLPKHAVLVNVGRGETLQTEALVKVLRGSHLGGAGLDVIVPEPVSESDSIWKTPRLLITSHAAAHFPERGPAIEAFAERQLKQYLSKETIEDLVDLNREGV
ncbi:MAG: hypothetical protein HY590_03610 [Candidatus Omnitrophica bacterium]|nr:hypothetical protein [Candidatus Omnitrophota bacterium]